MTLPCSLTSKQSKEAVSAINRASSAQCKDDIANLVCSIHNGKVYPESLPRYCKSKVDPDRAGEHEGCFQDSFNQRLFQGDMIKFKPDNSPQKCQEHCLANGFIFAGVQYGLECFCGNSLPQDKVNWWFSFFCKNGKKFDLLAYQKFIQLSPVLFNTNCLMGSQKTYLKKHLFRICHQKSATWPALETLPWPVEDTSPWTSTGCYWSVIYPTWLWLVVFSTGHIPLVPPKIGTVGEVTGSKVKIVYLLTIAGRASRQVHRLVKQIYSPHHYILVHVDSRWTGGAHNLQDSKYFLSMV